MQLLNTIWSGTCYKISTERTSHSAVNRGYSPFILVEYNKLIEINNLPLLKAYFTSEKNAYGVTFSEWMDGEVLEFNIETNVYQEISLRPERYIYLRAKSKCIDDSFYECFGFKFLSNNFNECPRKCLPNITFPSYARYEEKEYTVCQTNEEIECSTEIAKQMFDNITETDACLKSCSILQYSGKVQYKEKYDDTHATEFKYRFAKPQSVKVHEEYLIYDEIGLIGSVGGTLGIFIGFSFSGVVTCVINIVQQVKNIIKIKLIPSNGSPNVTVVKSAFDEIQSNQQIFKNFAQSMPGKYDGFEKNVDDNQKFGLIMKDEKIIENMLGRLDKLEYQIENKFVKFENK